MTYRYRITFDIDVKVFTESHAEAYVRKLMDSLDMEIDNHSDVRLLSKEVARVKGAKE